MANAKTIRVLVVDDSPIFVDILQRAIESDPYLRVVGVATDGKMAAALASTLAPDLITMDVLMPVMDGLEAIGRIMADRPTPILVLTGDPRGKTDTFCFEALRRGALDLLPKITAWIDDPREREKLCAHMKLLSRVCVLPHLESRAQRRRDNFDSLRLNTEGLRPRPSLRLVAIAASTGGPAALAGILGQLPKNFPAGIAIVQHLPSEFAPSLCRWLGSVSPLEVKLAAEGDVVSGGRVLVAAEEAHLTFDAGGRVRYRKEPAAAYYPSANELFKSAARVFGPSCAGVVLTGMGDDGARGLLELRQAGALTVAQDEASSLIFGMPQAACRMGAAEATASLSELPALLRRAARCSPGMP